MCPVQRGLNGQKTKCVRCKNRSSCGSCQEDYRKCDYKISKCTRSVRKTKAAGSVKKLSWKAFKKDVYQNRDKCGTLFSPSSISFFCMYHAQKTIEYR